MWPVSSRRRFLERAAGAAAAAWLAPVAPARAGAERGETVLGALPFLDEGAFPLERTVGSGLGRRRAIDLSTLSPSAPLVPPDRFFIRTGVPDALPSPASWRIRLRGLVEAPSEMDVDALRGEASDLGVHLLECSGNSRGAHFGFLSAARWTGVPLARVLDRVKGRAGANRVLVSGFDRHSAPDPGSVPGASWIFGLDEIRESGALLAVGMDGGPLAPDHGHPVRLVVPGWYGCTAIKWVDEIALVGDDAPATDQMREYAGRTHQDPAGARERARDFRPATIDPAAVPVRAELVRAAGGAIACRVSGIAWGGRAPVRTLRIRVRSELPLAPVERMEAAAGPWTFWSHTFRPAAPGRYRIELAMGDPAVRARRLEAGYYVREFEIPRA
jgi:DMSO/TMAO reductase YedYZ molybdopterin-dependent catalytic subunit